MAIYGISQLFIQIFCITWLQTGPFRKKWWCRKLEDHQRGSRGGHVIAASWPVCPACFSARNKPKRDLPCSLLVASMRCIPNSAGFLSWFKLECSQLEACTKFIEAGEKPVYIGILASWHILASFFCMADRGWGSMMVYSKVGGSLDPLWDMRLPYTDLTTVLSFGSSLNTENEWNNKEQRRNTRNDMEQHE